MATGALGTVFGRQLFFAAEHHQLPGFVHFLSGLRRFRMFFGTFLRGSFGELLDQHGLGKRLFIFKWKC